MAEIQAKKQAAIEYPEQWLAENEETIKAYQEFLASPEYLTSPLKTIKDKLQRFLLDHHYYEIAIPLIRQFSPQYNSYYEQLGKASQIMEDKIKE